MNYQAYIASQTWFQRREKHLGQNPACFVCETRSRLHVHHNTYERLGDEADRDLVTMCESCHMLAHRMIDGKVPGWFLDNAHNLLRICYVRGAVPKTNDPHLNHRALERKRELRAKRQAKAASAPGHYRKGYNPPMRVQPDETRAALLELLKPGEFINRGKLIDHVSSDPRGKKHRKRLRASAKRHIKAMLKRGDLVRQGEGVMLATYKATQ